MVHRYTKSDSGKFGSTQIMILQKKELRQSGGSFELTVLYVNHCLEIFMEVIPGSRG